MLSLERLSPGDDKTRAFKIRSIFLKTTPSSESSVLMNLVCITASAIASTQVAVAGWLESMVKSKDKIKNHIIYNILTIRFCSLPIRPLEIIL